jgi:hypothetical protein
VELALKTVLTERRKELARLRLLYHQSVSGAVDAATFACLSVSRRDGIIRQLEASRAPGPPPAPPPPAGGRSLQRALSRPLWKLKSEAYEERLQGPDFASLRAQHHSQRGWAGTAWLGCGPWGSTKISNDELRGCFQVYLMQGATELPDSPVQAYAGRGRRAVLIGKAKRPLLVSGATLLNDVWSSSAWDNGYIHDRFALMVDSIIKSLPGAITVVKTPPDTPSTTQEQREGLGRRALYQVDRLYTGVECCPTSELLIEIKTCNPCSARHLRPPASSADAPAAAAAVLQRFGLATYSPVLHPSQTLECFAMEIFGGCTRRQADGRGFVETLQGYADEVAKALVPGVDISGEEAGSARQKAAAQTMQAWRTLVSVGLARARGAFFRSAVLDCVHGASGVSSGVPPVALASYRLDNRALGRGG